MKRLRTDLQMEVNLRRRAWGLSLTGRDLHLSAVQNKFNAARFKAHAVLEDFAQMEDADVRAFIEGFLDEHKLKQTRAFLSFPVDQVLIHMAEFPSDALETLDEVLEYQLENIFPGNYDAHDFFHQVISKGEVLKVMVIAVKKEIMGKLFSQIRKWDLRLSGITLDCLAQFNMLGKLGNDAFKRSRIMLLQFDRSHLQMVGFRLGRFAGEYHFDFDADQLDATMVPGLEEGFSRCRMDPNEVDGFICAGAPRARVKSFLEEDIGMPLESWRDSYGEEVPAQALPAFSLAVTALHDHLPFQLNMLPVPLRKKHRQGPLIIVSLAAILLLGYFGYQQFGEYRTLRKERQILSHQIEQLEEQIQQLSAVQMEHATKQEEVDSISKFLYSDALLLKVLNVLSRELPVHTYLTSFRINDGNQLTLTGESEEPFAVRSHLQSLPILRNVDTANAITPGRDKSKKKFTFKADLILEALK